MLDIDLNRCIKLSGNNFLVLDFHYKERKEAMDKC